MQRQIFAGISVWHLMSNLGKSARNTGDSIWEFMRIRLENLEQFQYYIPIPVKSRDLHRV